MPKAPEIDEEKVARLMALVEQNVEDELTLEGGVTIGGIYVAGTGKRKKVDRRSEMALSKELTAAECAEFERRRRAKAKAYWEEGDNKRKYLWGGW
jgi:hypothetical protein